MQAKEPTLPHAEQRKRATALFERRQVDCALIGDPAAVTWLTGFAAPVQSGPSPFRGQPAYVWFHQGTFTCLVQEGHAGELAPLADDEDARVVPYPTYRMDGPIAIARDVAEALGRVLESAPPTGTSGMELASVPASLAGLVERRSERVTAIDGWHEPLRMVKTDEELAHLREAFALTDVGHAAARAAVGVGAREIDVWTAVQGAVERHAGRRVPLGNDCVVGRREGNVGGWPEAWELRDGDSLILDLGARVGGYWSDSCATYVAGAPPRRLVEIHDAVARALDHGIGRIRPGVAANAVDRSIRAVLEEAGYAPHPHHSGHGVGTSSHERPRLAPYDDTPLEPGMVILVEPGVYLPGELGVRLEDAVLVTEEGAELLTRHDKRLVTVQP